MSFVTAQNILYDHQYGFRPKHSTIDPIIHLLNNCAASFSKHNPEMTLAILCDLSKAFDVIDWFKNYLSGRQQYVDIDGVTLVQRIT